MYGQIATVAFVGIEARAVEVQVRISGGQHVFAIVGTKYRGATACGWPAAYAAVVLARSLRN